METMTIAWKAILIVILFITAIIQKRNIKILKAKVAHKNSIIMILRYRLGDRQDNAMPKYENPPPPPPNEKHISEPLVFELLKLNELKNRFRATEPEHKDQYYQSIRRVCRSGRFNTQKGCYQPTIDNTSPIPPKGGSGVSKPESDSLFLKVHDQRIIPQCTNCMHHEKDSQLSLIRCVNCDESNSNFEDVKQKDYKEFKYHGSK